MKTLARMTVLLVVLGLCLPSYGEILVYKATQTMTSYTEVAEGEWDVMKETSKSYLVIDVNYTTNTFTQSASINYGRDPNGKFFEENALSLELVRVTSDDRVRWVVLQEEIEPNEMAPSGSIYALAGLASDRNIGTGTKSEAAAKLKGSGFEDRTNEGLRELGLASVSATLYSAWTVRANGTGTGQLNQSFSDTLAFIEVYLTSKGYENRPEVEP